MYKTCGSQFKLGIGITLTSLLLELWMGFEPTIFRTLILLQNCVTKNQEHAAASNGSFFNLEQLFFNVQCLRRRPLVGNFITKVVKQREQILQVILPRTYFVKAGIKITKEVFAKENNTAPLKL